ncbi:MAG TPA: hypothetical protein VLZ74_16730 [Methylocella sp.]|nr:hypothetical protein [Methylocella sp.]
MIDLLFHGVGGTESGLIAVQRAARSDVAYGSRVDGALARAF